MKKEFLNSLRHAIKSPREGFALALGLALRRWRNHARSACATVFVNLKTLFLLFLLSGCALFKPTASIEDPLLNFYQDTPPAHTQAALRLTERAREEVRVGKYAVATEHLQKALTIDPQCSFAYYFLALSSHQNGDYKKSNGFLEKAKQLFTPFPFWKAQSYDLAGKNFEKLGNEKMAHAQFKKAKEIDPSL